jgi:glycosyltransferase involved in cell wall biosynthesis
MLQKMNPILKGPLSFMKLSVTIITLNEASSIGAVLDSVAFADEIIVLDSGSTDGTIELCRERGARVEMNSDWQGFGVQKNRALALAQGEWVLSVDADEVLTPLLAKEIQQKIHNSERHVAWMIPRASSYCGHVMRHGGWWPDYVLRLFQREGSRFSDDMVHERLIPPPGQVGRLVHPFQHQTYETLEEVIQTVNRYSSEGALQAFRLGKRASFHEAILHGVWAFIRTYFLRLGFLDGPHGFMLSVSNAEATYYRYLKLWLLAQTPNTR